MTDGGGEMTSPIDPYRQRAVESLFHNLPEGFGERYVALQAIRQAFYSHLAASLQPALNNYVKTQRQDTYEERGELASWINQSLRKMGLSLICPTSNKPAILITDWILSGERKILRYRFQTTEPSGKRVRSCTSYELPDLEVTQGPSRIEGLSKQFKDRDGEHAR